MQKFKFSKNDLRFYFEKNKAIYFMLLFCFFLGIAIAIIISLSKSSYLGLLNIKNKVVINMINGSISLENTFWECIRLFVQPALLIFLFSLNFYLNILSFIFLSYQSSLLYLTIFALIQSYGFGAILKVFFILLPVNILYFLILMFWIVACTNRVKYAHKIKKFSSGYNYEFITNLYIVLIGLFLLCLLVGGVVPIILKSAIFIIF